MTGASPAGEARRAGLLLLGQDGHEAGASVPKLETGISGFDYVAMGGLPARRATVVAGQAGSAKTVFAAQFLAEGVRRGQPAVFVTLEESAADLRANLRTLGWEVPDWEDRGDWRFVDASPVSGPSGEVAPYSLETLVAQIGQAIDATGADRVVLDSISAMLALHDDTAAVRQQLRSLIARLRSSGLTVLLTVETPGDPGDALSRYGIEEFVADNVVLLRNVREGTFRRRTLEVLKMRGAMHHKGDVPFTVVPGQGLVVLPVRPPSLAATSDERVGLGNPALDEMAGGGLFRGSCALVAGPTGAGKTLLANEFLAAGCARGERGLLFAYEETREQVLRNARGWGHDFAALEREGLLTIVSLYPEVASLDDHLVEIKALVDQVRPARVVVDSLSALERLGSAASYRALVIGLTSYIKETGVVSVVTSSSADLVGGTSVTESHISGLIDAIVLLRYVERDSAVRRGLAVLKMRGSAHDAHIREFTVVDRTGMVIGEPFDRLSSVLSGEPVVSG
jgi:circadian clock protein KaiC